MKWIENFLKRFTKPEPPTIDLDVTVLTDKGYATKTATFAVIGKKPDGSLELKTKEPIEFSFADERIAERAFVNCGGEAIEVEVNRIYPKENGYY